MVVRRGLLAVVGALLGAVLVPLAAQGSDGESFKEDFGDIAGLDAVEFPSFELGGSVDDVDRFGFSLSEPKRVGIGLRQLTVNADLFLDDSGGTVLGQSEKSGDSREWVALDLGVGDYVIRVVAVQGGGTNYVLRYGVSDPSGPNLVSGLKQDFGDIAGLDAVEFPSFELGGSVGDVDRFGFSLSERKRVGIGLRQLAVNADLFLEDSEGTVLGRSEKSGDDREWVALDLGVGDYVIRVVAAQGGGTNYVLRYGVSDPSTPDDEANEPQGDDEVQGAVDTAGTVSPTVEHWITNAPRGGVELEMSLDDPDNPINVEWQWKRSDSESGTYTDVSGETTASYTPVAGDAGKWLRVVATYDDDKAMDHTAMWTAPAAVKVGTVTVTGGPPRVGAQLEASLSDPDNPTTVEWQWKRSDSESGTYTDVSGETTASYTPVAGDAGKWLRVVATYDDDGGSSRTATWTASAAVPSDTAGTVTLIGGPPRVGGQLETYLVDPDRPTNLEFQWQVSDSESGSYTDISRISTASGGITYDYTPVAGDAGKWLRMVATYDDDFGTGKTAVWTASTAVTSDSTTNVGSLLPGDEEDVVFLGIINNFERPRFDRHQLGGSEDDRLWFSFIVGRSIDLGQVIRANFGLRQLDADVDLILRDKNGDVVAASRGSDEDSPSISVNLVGPKYYLEVRALEDGANSFNLRYSVSLPGPKPVRETASPDGDWMILSNLHVPVDLEPFAFTLLPGDAAAQKFTTGFYGHNLTKVTVGFADIPAGYDPGDLEFALTDSDYVVYDSLNIVASGEELLSLPSSGTVTFTLASQYWLRPHTDYILIVINGSTDHSVKLDLVTTSYGCRQRPCSVAIKYHYAYKRWTPPGWYAYDRHWIGDQIGMVRYNNGQPNVTRYSPYPELKFELRGPR